MKRIKWLLLGFSLVGLVGGLVLSSQAQQQGSALLGPQEALQFLAQAVTCFDVLLLENDGIASGTLQDAPLAMELENGGGSRTFNRENVDTLELATPTNGLLKDRVTLWSGEVFQGTLQVASFQVQLSTGEDITLPQEQVRGVLFVSSIGGGCPPSEGIAPPPRPEEIIEVFKRLVNNSLTPSLVNSLSKYDWLLLSNQGIVSGFVCDEQFTMNLKGQQVLFTPEEFSAILFARTLDLVWLKSGELLEEGKLSGSELCLDSTYQEGQTSLERRTLRGVIFQAILSGGGI